MSDNIPHNYEWSYTESIIKEFCYLLKHFQDDKEKLEEIFLKTPVFATEKLDGTNVSKDVAGQLYGRRVQISADKTEYQNKTPLANVKDADIRKIKSDICNNTEFNEEDVLNFILYGELICNHFYDYDKRSLYGKWTVFGARVVAQNNNKVYQVLANKGFVVKKKGQGEDVLILANIKFFELGKISIQMTINKW